VQLNIGITSFLRSPKHTRSRLKHARAPCQTAHMHLIWDAFERSTTTIKVIAWSREARARDQPKPLYHSRPDLEWKPVHTSTKGKLPLPLLPHAIPDLTWNESLSTLAQEGNSPCLCRLTPFQTWPGRVPVHTSTRGKLPLPLPPHAIPDQNWPEASAGCQGLQASHTPAPGQVQQLQLRACVPNTAHSRAG